MADRIGVMNRGQLVQVGAPSEVYEQPNSRWIAGFIGNVNLIEGRVAATGPQGTEIKSETAGRFQAAQPVDVPLGTSVWLAVRPEKVSIAADAPERAQGNVFPGKVLDIGYLGDSSTYKVKLDNGLVMSAVVPNRTRLIERRIGRDDRVWLSFPPDAGVVLTR